MTDGTNSHLLKAPITQDVRRLGDFENDLTADSCPFDEIYHSPSTSTIIQKIAVFIENPFNHLLDLTFELSPLTKHHNLLEIL